KPPPPAPPVGRRRELARPPRLLPAALPERQAAARLDDPEFAQAAQRRLELLVADPRRDELGEEHLDGQRAPRRDPVPLEYPENSRLVAASHGDLRGSG